MTSSKEFHSQLLLYEIHNWLGRILLKPLRYQHTAPAHRTGDRGTDRPGVRCQAWSPASCQETDKWAIHWPQSALGYPGARSETETGNIWMIIHLIIFYLPFDV